MSQENWDKLEGYKDAIIRGDTIAELWSIEDVQSCADTPMDDETARDVLAAVVQGFDANFGINWEVISSRIDMGVAA